VILSTKHKARSTKYKALSMSTKQRQKKLGSVLGSCLTSSRDVIAACTRASLIQLRATPEQRALILGTTFYGLPTPIFYYTLFAGDHLEIRIYIKSNQTPQNNLNLYQCKLFSRVGKRGTLHYRATIRPQKMFLANAIFALMVSTFFN
jgi:hypothetical protein